MGHIFTSSSTATQTPTYLKVAQFHNSLAKLCNCDNSKVAGSTNWTGLTNILLSAARLYTFNAIYHIVCVAFHT